MPAQHACRKIPGGPGSVKPEAPWATWYPAFSAPHTVNAIPHHSIGPTLGPMRTSSANTQ
jgi:hypothetical protein